MTRGLTVRAFTCVIVSAAVFACGAARQASFAMAEPGCSSNPTACEQRCEAMPPDREACDVLKVLQAETIVQGGTQGMDARSMKSLDDELGGLCHYGITRACRASDGLKPIIAKASAEESAKREQDSNTKANAAANRTAFQGRVAEMKQETERVLKALGRHPGSLAANRALARLADAERCRNACPEILGEAEANLHDAKTDLGRLEAERKAADAERAEKDATGAAWKVALDSCQADVPQCQKDCAADVASYACQAIAVLVSVGDARVSKTANPERAQEIAKKGCDAGNKIGCAAVGKFEEMAAPKRAEAKIPGLFTKCATNRAAIERWRIAGVQAAKANDQAAASRASQKIQEIEPEWNTTLSELRDAIRLVTNNEGARYNQLIAQVKSQCSCEPSRSGACR